VAFLFSDLFDKIIKELTLW